MDGTQIGQTLVATQYEEAVGSYYGNPTRVIEYSYNGTDTTESLTKTTNLSYNYYTANGEYIIDRTSSKIETHSRPAVASGVNHANEVHTTTFSYDSIAGSRLLVNETLSSGNSSVSKTYSNRDDFGNVQKINTTGSSSPNRESENLYDLQGRYVNQTIQGNQIEHIVLARDKYGNPQETQNKQGVSSFISYDDFGRPFYQIDEYGQWQQSEYGTSALGYCSSDTAYHLTVSSVGPTSWQCFDMLGREIRTVTQDIQAAQQVYVDSHYDTSGRLLEKSVPMFSVPVITNADHWNRSAYDETGRSIFTRNAEGNQTTTAYSALSMSVNNARNHSTTTVTNILGEVQSVTDAGGNVIVYEYDDIGKQTSLDGPLAGTVDRIVTDYDDLGNVKSINDPNLGIWNYSYNAIGELLYQRDAKANCTVMTYDNLGRMTSKTYRSNENITCDDSVNANSEGSSSWFYDNVSTSASFGLLLSEYNQKVIKNYFYDGLARLENVNTSFIDTLHSFNEFSYYDAYNRPLALFDATGHSVRMVYTVTGYQHQVIDQATETIYQTIDALSAFGEVWQQTAGNGVSTVNARDNLGRVTNIHTSFSNTDIQHLNYVYDSVGNLKSREDARDLGNEFYEEFIYDNLNRLDYVQAETGGSGLVTTMDFAYDAGGRITDFNGDKYCYSGDSIHGVDTIRNNNCSGSVIKSFDYDSNGSQTNSNGRNLTYTAFNKTETMSGNGASVEFEYGPNNSRFKRVDVGPNENETTYYIGNVEYIEKADGTIQHKRYIGDAVITYWANNFGNGAVNYLHKDHLGSVQSVTQGFFDILTTDHLSYDAYGQRRDAGNNSTVLDINPIPNVTKKGYTGQEHVDQLGIINYNARLYDPTLGIMLQADTIIPDGPVTQSMNRYSYVFNNPLSYTDPSGHAAVKVTDVDGNVTRVTLTDEQLKKFLKDAAKSDPDAKVTVYIPGVQNAAIDNSDTSDNVSESTSQETKLYKGPELAWETTAEFFGDAKYIKNTLSLAYDQATDETSQEIAKGVAIGMIPLGWLTKFVPGFRWLGNVGPAGSGIGSSAGQLTANGCGMACGQFILNSKGLLVFQSNLAKGFFKGLEPSTLARNLNAFQKGWKGGYVYPSAKQLTGLASNGKFIARIGGNPGHFVVVQSISKGRVNIWNPSGGINSSTSLSNFTKQVSGLVWKQ